MTKTLTEQWREGKLPVGSYYINLVGNVERVDFFGGLGFERTKDFGIEEVLAPVPSYDEYKELVRKSDKLEKIMSDAVTNQGDCQQIVEDNLNRQIKRLQEQPNEANYTLIKSQNMKQPDRNNFVAQYLLKWGVK